MVAMTLGEIMLADELAGNATMPARIDGIVAWLNSIAVSDGIDFSEETAALVRVAANVRKQRNTLKFL
jgi:hypothetical protein